MRILGLYCGHDSSAAVVEDGKVLVALEEERLTGIKKIQGFPARSLLYICELLKCGTNDFDKVMIATPCTHWGRPHSEEMGYHKLYPNAELVPHHKAHAAIAYSWSGWDDCTVLTADGGGDEFFASVNECKDGKMKRLGSSRIDEFEAIGMLYYHVTEALGFTPNRHEGKVMGLAARGKDQGILSGLFWSEGTQFKAIGGRKDNIVQNRMEEHSGKFKRENWSATVQAEFERIMLKWVEDNYTGKPLAVSGGCFANVLLNMKIAEKVQNLYVVPPMLDNGLSVGAALCGFDKIPVQAQIDVYFGVENTPREKNIYPASVVAQMIRGGLIVGLMQGRMEYGPRALGNRSILADPRNPAINDLLNRRLGRSEFMPFAPAILAECSTDILCGYENGTRNGPFMTSCWAVKEKWKSKIPAVVHLDGTARPQVVYRTDGPNTFYYDIIEEFYKLTGIPCVINTSFNAHEDPILAWSGEADYALRNRRIDILVEGGKP